MKIIHTADIHLSMDMRGSMIGAEAAEAHRKEMFRTFSRLIGEVRDSKADILLIAGDLFEMRCATSLEVARVFDFFREIPDTHVFISCGNHDPLTAASLYGSMELPDNVTVFPAEMGLIELEDPAVCVYGFSWDRNAYDSVPFSLPAPDRDKFNILLLHCDVTGRSRYMPVNLKTLSGLGFDYVALGHIHRPIRLKENICYPGSLEPLDFSETGEHGYIMVEGEKGELKVNFVPFAASSFADITVDAQGAEGLTQLKDRAAEAIKEAGSGYVRLTFTGTTGSAVDTEWMKEELSGSAKWLDIKDGTVRDYDLIKLYRENSDNIIGRFILELMNDPAGDGTSEEALRVGLDALLGNGGGRV